MTISLLNDMITRLHCVCEACGISPDDIRMEDFNEHDRARWRLRAQNDIRRHINGEPGSCIPSQKPDYRVFIRLTDRLHPDRVVAV